MDGDRVSPVDPPKPYIGPTSAGSDGPKVSFTADRVSPVDIEATPPEENSIDMLTFKGLERYAARLLAERDEARATLAAMTEDLAVLFWDDSDELCGTTSGIWRERIAEIAGIHGD